ncbi:DUF2125 domain-containing protein [Rhodoplanes sp. Z2-YC6860]|uniref:DUF2125 domain-containing protein n=1 Tax=Rhodoplanes sp. Z2-YC6860 TaxID=674703 RepID=UPI00078C0A1B|nr:DUF2125 domain-containing protein [Rhodoplanes sp. Z2-YC6860]AMN39671.1 hypothetical protein RHPLAN_12100 [Rhodoplanes sp. Z2-YC6860]
MIQADSIPRRRRWPIVLIALLVILGALWAGGWGYGAGVAERTLEGWKAREAKAGRVYNCASQSIGGFPFGIEARCTDASAELKTNQPPLSLKAKGMLVSAALWKPTVLTTEFTGPLTVAQPGQQPFVTVTWQYARTELHGLPTSPESAAIHLDQLAVDRTEAENVFKATRADLNARLVSGTVRENPVIETVVKLVGASAQAWHPAAAIPTDADITAVVRGLKDFAPKPWQQRLRELQAAGGRIEIASARVQQGETIAVANGVLSLSPAGRLDGQLRLTVANLEKFLPALGLDQMLAEQRAPPKLNNAFGALDRIMPGLGNVARQNAGPALVASLGLMGQPTELEGQRAVALPLRFDDGMVSLGPLKLGMTPPLY